MAEPIPPIPSFNNPPLHEMVLGVQFAQLPHFDLFILGKLRELYLGDFPKEEVQPPLDPIYEQFGAPEASSPSVRFKAIESSDLVPRCWFLSENKDRLIQVQRDRFVHNWRKQEGGSDYPRYGALKESFAASLTKMIEFCSNYQMGEWKPNQCEVAYINHIPSGDGWESHSEINKLLVGLSSESLSFQSPDFEDFRMTKRFVYKREDKSPFARLHMTLTPAFIKSNDNPMYVLQFVFRGEPDSRDLEGVLRFMDLGREIVVRAFAEVTTPEMHKIWGRTQ